MTPVSQADAADPRLPPVASHVFLSHCTLDRDRFVGPFARRLRERGIRVWIDQGEIRPGDSLVQRIFGDGIGRADAVVIVLSRHSAASPWVWAEIDAACVRRILDGIRVVVVRLDGAPVPPALRTLRYVQVDPAAGWSAEFEQIVATLTGAPETAVAAPGPKPSVSRLRRALGRRRPAERAAGGRR